MGIRVNPANSTSDGIRKPDIETPTGDNNEHCGASFIVAPNRHRSLGLVDDETPLVSEWFGGGQNGLMWTFLIMLLPMLIASLLGVKARKTYLRDVATAAVSSRADKS